MLSDKMVDALNDHMNKEMYSAYLYMSMSAYADAGGLKGFAKWFLVQYHEEMFHAMKMYEYIQAQGGTIRLLQIDEPPFEWDSALDLFEKTLAHEQMVTSRINALMDLAIEDRDHATNIFLQWYVTEQVEEEANVNDIVAPLRMVGDDKSGLMMIEQQLAKRLPPVAIA